MWKFLTKVGDYELWKTPGKYLVIFHYIGYNKFFYTYKEAYDFLLKKVKSAAL